MQNRCKAEADHLIANTCALVAESRAHLAQLQSDLAASRSFLDETRRGLNAACRVLVEIEQRERCGVQHIRYGGERRR